MNSRARKGSIESREKIFQKLNDETECTRKKMEKITKNRVPAPINMDLHAEYLVLQRLLELGLDAVHNKEGKWPRGKRRDSADICVFCREKSLLIEVKFSKYWKSDSPEWRWQFQNIDPEKFDFLILVGEAPDTEHGANRTRAAIENAGRKFHFENAYRFFIFTNKEANLYIPPFDWAWRPKSDKKYTTRWIGIYESTNDWRKHVKEWNPNSQNPRKAKNKYMVHENSHIGYVANHLNNFENRWNKILAVAR